MPTKEVNLRSIRPGKTYYRHKVTPYMHTGTLAQLREWGEASAQPFNNITASMTTLPAPPFRRVAFQLWTFWSC